MHFFVFMCLSTLLCFGDSKGHPGLLHRNTGIIWKGNRQSNGELGNRW